VRLIPAARQLTAFVTDLNVAGRVAVKQSAWLIAKLSKETAHKPELTVKLFKVNNRLDFNTVLEPNVRYNLIRCQQEYANAFAFSFVFS